MKRTIQYIAISEDRHLYSNGGLRLDRHANIQFTDENKQEHVRGYYHISEASILRLARIQEKLALGMNIPQCPF